MTHGLMRMIPAVMIALYGCVLMIPCTADAQDDLRAASEAIRIQKKLYIEKMMALTPLEKQVFWALYDEYESGLLKIKGELIELTANFLKRQGFLSDAEAIAMLNQKLRIDGDALKFKRSYVVKFMQVLPGRKVARFYQAENRFETDAISELYRNIPVIR